jgi:hypothetical protein
MAIQHAVSELYAKSSGIAAPEAERYFETLAQQASGEILEKLRMGLPLI